MSRLPFTLVLTAGLCACASDVWFKPGAGTDALSLDKATCRSQSEDLAPQQARAAFERCMAERDWWHMVPGEAETLPVPENPATLDAATPSVGAALAEQPTAMPSRDEIVPEGPPDTETTQRSASTESPAARTTAGGGAEHAVRLRARPTDAGKRQFWFKWGAGTAQLATDQQACRGLLGLGEHSGEPSRWGQDPDFDRCMRERGWSGGSIQSR